MKTPDRKEIPDCPGLFEKDLLKLSYRFTPQADLPAAFENRLPGALT